MHEGEDEFGELVDLLTGELENAVAATLAARSPRPARDFAGQILRADLAATDPGRDSEAPESTESTGIPEMPEPGALGQSVAFFIVARWITALHQGGFTGNPEVTAVDWVGRHLGAEPAATTRQVAGALGAPGESAGPAGADFVPALVWLAAGLTAEYGDGDPGWLRRHTETVAALHTGCLPPAPRAPS